MDIEQMKSELNKIHEAQIAMVKTLQELLIEPLTQGQKTKIIQTLVKVGACEVIY